MCLEWDKIRSVLDPRCFISYTEDVVDLFDKHKVLSHLYADDTQFHDSCRHDDTDSLRTRLSSCANDIISRCMSRRLQLNSNKRGSLRWIEVVQLGLQDSDRYVSGPTVVRRP